MAIYADSAGMLRIYVGQPHAFEPAKSGHDVMWRTVEDAGVLRRSHSPRETAGHRQQQDIILRRHIPYRIVAERIMYKCN